MTATHEQIVIAGLKALIQGQQKTNMLLETLLARLTQQQTQLENWKRANPELSQDCKRASEVLGKAQSEYLQGLTEQVLEDGEDMDSWTLQEFIDKYGQRLAQFNGMLAYLAQLGAS